MNEFILTIANVLGGAAALIWISVMVVQSSHVGDMFRYPFSHITLIASFLALMSRIFRPPSLIDLYRYSRAILGEVLLSHMESLIIWVRASSMFGGIPWAIVRNWVWPPMIAWIMRRFPYSVG